MDEGNFNKIVIIVFLILIEIVLFYFIWIGYNTNRLMIIIAFLLGLTIIIPTSKFKPKAKD